MDIQAIKPGIAAIAKRYGLDLVVLFGSQATGRTHIKSDVDIGYTARLRFDLSTLFRIEKELSGVLTRNDIEFVDLRRVSPVMKKIVADEGILLYEDTPGLFVIFGMYAFKLFVETKQLRELRYQSLKRFAHGQVR